MSGLLPAAGLLITSLTALCLPSGASAISTANQVAHWTFDQSTGTALTNNAGGGYNGTFSGTPTWTAGQTGNALSFNDTDYVEIGNVTQANNVPRVTITGWMKRNSATGNVMVAKRLTNHDLGIGAFGDGKVYFKTSNGSDAGGSLTLSDTNWHHYALVFDGTLSGNTNRLKAYVDGTLRTLTYIGTIPSATTANTTPFRMGHAMNDYSNGLIDEVRLFSRALSAAEVLELAAPPPADTAAPSVPTGLSGQPTSASQVTLSWNSSTDNVGVTGYRVFRNGQSIGTTAAASLTDSGLSASTGYSYTVAAYDAATNQSAPSASVTVTTLDPAPLPVVDLGASPGQVASGGSATLSWSSTNASGCTASNGWTGSKAASGSQTISNITSTRTFVLTCSGPGGQGADSVSVTVLPHCSDNLDNDVDGVTDLSDPGCVNASDNDETNPDVTAPSVPSSLSATAFSGSQINLSWSASTDNVGVTGYRVFRNGSPLTTVTTTSFQDTGLAPSTTYSYSVSAYDAATNESVRSQTVQSTTLNTTLTNGPLRVSTNGRYFMDASGKTKILNGSHTWLSLQDFEGMPILNFSAYLNFLTTNKHNFFRLWIWEQSIGLAGGGDMRISPVPYQRTGPGTGYDGLPKFDLNQFNQAYFDRMRERVITARDSGIYVAIMMFNGFSVVNKSGGPGNPCNGHPFNATNNINSINVATSPTNGSCASAHTLSDARVTALQEAYVAKVIETLGDLDNVLWEISNESEATSTTWQYRMINFIRTIEASRPMKHPIGMTFQYPWGSNGALFGSPADWISPNGDGGYNTTPPEATGQKVIIIDTDHLWGYGGEYQWMWRSIITGHSVTYMDCYNVVHDQGCSSSYVNGSTRWDLVRNLGYARTLLDRTNLATLTPQGTLASSGLALARTGSGGEYVVYMPSGNSVNVNLTTTSGTLVTEWLNPLTGAIHLGTVAGGATRTLTAPFSGAGVLYIHA